MNFNFFPSNEKNNNRKRGSPKRCDGENKSKRFNLVMKPSTMAELNRIAAHRQLQTGIRSSVTEVINEILENYITKGEI